MSLVGPAHQLLTCLVCIMVLWANKWWWWYQGIAGFPQWLIDNRNNQFTKRNIIQMFDLIFGSVPWDCWNGSFWQIFVFIVILRVLYVYLLYIRQCSKQIKQTVYWDHEIRKGLSAFNLVLQFDFIVSRRLHPGLNASFTDFGFSCICICEMYRFSLFCFLSCFCLRRFIFMVSKSTYVMSVNIFFVNIE